MKKILIIVAHPDDEVLGCGGYIASETDKNNIVDLLILSGNVSARQYRPSVSELNKNLEKSSKLLNINSVFKGHFKNIEFNLIPHIKIVNFIESYLVKIEPDVVITHHPSDLNKDHYFTSYATQVAVRLSQRNNNVKPVSELLFMEVLSSTEWNINPSVNPFLPNYFYQLNQKQINTKIEALKFYLGVMRPRPHPRSIEVITSLALLRGSQAGYNFAEAFQIAFKRE